MFHQGYRNGEKKYFVSRWVNSKCLNTFFLLLTLSRYFFVLMDFGCHSILGPFKNYYFTKKEIEAQKTELCEVLCQIGSRTKSKGVWLINSLVLFLLGLTGADLFSFPAVAKGPGHSNFSSALSLQRRSWCRHGLLPHPVLPVLWEQAVPKVSLLPRCLWCQDPHLWRGLGKGKSGRVPTLWPQGVRWIQVALLQSPGDFLYLCQ